MGLTPKNSVAPEQQPAQRLSPGGAEPAAINMNILRRFSAVVDRGLTQFFTAEGRFIARRPWLVIIICTVIALACASGFTKFEVENDAEKLYTPNDEPSFKDKDYVDDLYRSDELFSKILALDKEKDGSNVLDKRYLLEHMRAWEELMAATVTLDGRTTRFADVCAQVSDVDRTCKVESVLRFWNYSAARLQADDNILATINNRSNTDYLGRAPNYNWLFGGITRDQQGNVVRAEVMQTVVYLKINKTEQEDNEFDETAFEWEEKITDIFYYKFKSDIIRHYVAADAAVGKESSKAIDSDVTRLTGGYILLIIYTCVSLCRNSWVYQKLHVSLASFAAIGFAIVADFGLLSGLGVQFNFVCQVLPFLLVGVGVDNTFVILSNFFDQDPDASIEHRIAKTMGLAGSSILVSNITNIIAFAVGTYTSLEALYSFSIYASVGMAFVFIYQVTFFVAWLALDARREVRMRMSGGCCGCALPACCSKERFQEQLEGGLNGWTPETDMPKDHMSPPQPGSMDRSGGSPGSSHARGAVDAFVSYPAGDKLKQQQTGASRDITSPSIFGFCGGDRFNPHADTLATKIIARWLPAASLHPIGKALVLILEGVFLGFAIYGCTQVYADFNFRELFVPEGNWLHEAFKVEERYFGGEKTPANIYTKTALDGRDYFYYQDQLAAIKPALMADPYISDTPAVSSWYDDYIKWLNRAGSPYVPSLDVKGRPPNATAFNAWLKLWLDTDGRYAASKVVFNSTGHIISSRFDAYSKDVVDSAWAVKLVDSTRRIAETAAPDLQAIAFGFSYTFFDGFRSILMSTITNVAIAAGAVFIVTLILLADIGASLLVGTMVVLCDVGILGFMHYADLTFNSVTCIVLVLAVGISVDYAAHVMRAFLVSTGTRQQRAHAALAEIGGAVWNGAITTFLAIVMMSGAKHYIFTTIFEMFAVLILLAIWHGVVFLPVVLSLVGPPSYRSAEELLASKTPASAVEMA